MGVPEPGFHTASQVFGTMMHYHNQVLFLAVYCGVDWPEVLGELSHWYGP